HAPEAVRPATDPVLRLGQPGPVGDVRLDAPSALLSGRTREIPMMKQRSLRVGLAVTLALWACLFASPGTLRAEPTVEQWGVAEVVLRGPSGGNPFTEVELSARVSSRDRALVVAGFYDGAGVYRVRFMPDRPGEWRYATRSNRAELDGRTGRIEVTEPSPRNHGPVRVRDMFHFAYADGTPYYPVGTTCYAWTH